MHIDQSLIEACKAHKRAAQRELYEKLVPYLSGVSRRYLENPDDVKDALQESLVNIFRSIDGYDEGRSEFHTWATRITINCSLKICRTHRHSSPVEVDEQTMEALHIPCVLDRLSDEELLQYIRSMPVDFLEVFNLHAVDGYSHREISEMLGIHESLSRQRLSRAKKWLRERLTEEGEPQQKIENRI